MKSRSCMLFLVTGAVALAAPGTAPMTLDDCLATAAANHPALTAAAAGVSAATAAVGEARAPYYPQVDVNAGYHRWQRRIYLPNGIAPPGFLLPEIVGPLDDWNGGLVSRVTLYDFGERRAALDAARARLAGAEIDAGTTRADVAHAVRIAYYGLAAAKERQAVAEKNLARTESHLALAQARRESGAVPQVDVLRSEAEVASARLQLIDTQSRVRIATGRLNTVMGRHAGTPLEIVTDLPTMPPPTAEDLETLAARAAENRGAIRSGERRVEAAWATVSAARAARAPKLRADATYGWRDTALFPENQEWQIGISVDFPLFDAGSRARRLARSRAELAREEAAQASRHLQVREEVWSAASEVERAWNSIAANETAVRSGTESLRVIRERYQSGAALMVDLIDTQTVLAHAEASLAEARWTYLAARGAFDRAIGNRPRERR